MVESVWSRQEIITQLLKSPHGDLSAYIEPTRMALQSDPEFVAHCIAWHVEHGSIRDANVALPVLQLADESLIQRYALQVGTVRLVRDELRDNALAHLALLNPRELVQAYRFMGEVKGGSHAMRKLIARYVRAREAQPKWWDSAVQQFRGAMKSLYALGHVKPTPRAERILFQREYAKGSRFAAVKDMATFDDNTVVQAIQRHKLPFLTLRGALGERLKDPTILFAVMGTMTGTEVSTNANALRELGALNVPATRALFEQKLGALQTPKQGRKAPLLKTTRAAEALEKAGAAQVAAKLRGAQERQLDTAQGIEGNVLILGDKSGSMQAAIEYTRQLAAVMARLVRGKVYVVFFDTMPRVLDATGKSYDQLLAETRRMEANGGTSIGCGVRYAQEQRWDVDMIALVSDGAENQVPYFADAYTAYTQRVLDRDVPVYYFRVEPPKGYRPIEIRAVQKEETAFRTRCVDKGIDLQIFDVTGTDHYAIPTLLQTVRGSRYALVDEIYGTPLKTLDEVLPLKERGGTFAGV